MDTKVKSVGSLADEATYYSEMVSLSNSLPINTGLTSAQEQTMISVLGSPLKPLTTVDQPARVSPVVKHLIADLSLGNVVVTGIKPAIDSILVILNQAFELEKATNHDLKSVLSSRDMLNVRLRKPTSGKPSEKISNHAWGTAIDFKIKGHIHPGNTGQSIPRFIAVLLPLFNAAGWYSGIAFHDTMHFEVANETIRKWSAEGLLKAESLHEA